LLIPPKFAAAQVAANSIDFRAAPVAAVAIQKVVAAVFFETTACTTDLIASTY